MQLQERRRVAIADPISQGGFARLRSTLVVADILSSKPQRRVTTVAPQALTFFNGDFVNAQAHHFTARLKCEAGNEAGKQITLAWRVASCRKPRMAKIANM